MIRKWFSDLAGAVVIGTISLGSVIAVSWAATTWINSQVEKQVADTVKKIDDNAQELKELRALNLQIAQLIVLAKKDEAIEKKVSK